MTNDDLQKLKQKLPHDGVKQISDETGFTPQYVRDVLSGRRNINKQIIDSAIIIAETYQNYLINNAQKINSL